MEEKVISFFRFEDLRVYHKAIDYSQWVISNLPAPNGEAQAKLMSAFSSSAFDIALNIAEGSSRPKPNFDHYLKIAKTAIRECVFYTSVAARLELISPDQEEDSRELLMELTRMIGALIASLQRGPRSTREIPDEEDPFDSLIEPKPLDDLDLNL